jgi:hypothetical protein
MNLICCAVWGDGGTTGPWTFMNWAKSVSQATNARKIVFIRDAVPGLLDSLHALGIETLPWVLPQGTQRTGKYDCQTHRWDVILNHLKTNSYESVIVTDGSDVVVQSDPFPFLKNAPKPLVMATQLVTVGESEIDRGWMKSYLGNTLTMDKNPTLNYGCCAGRQPYFSQFYGEMYRILKLHPDTTDQAVAMHMSYTNWTDLVYIPPLSESWALNDAFWISPPEVRDGIAYPPGKQDPYKIVHFYPEAVAQRYNTTTPDSQCKKCASGVYNGRCYTCGAWE